ncbi:MAG: hypothetical protein ACJAUJ_001808 [Salibacteraceae bacterium]
MGVINSFKLKDIGRMKKLLLISFALSVSGCAATQVIPLINSEASKIELVKHEPSREKCEFLGDVQGTAKASDIGVATMNSRNDMRNSAYNMGANFVTMDTTTAANAMDWTGRNQVAITGRAFKCK